MLSVFYLVHFISNVSCLMFIDHGERILRGAIGSAFDCYQQMAHREVDSSNLSGGVSFCFSGLALLSLA